MKAAMPTHKSFFLAIGRYSGALKKEDYFSRDKKFIMIDDPRPHHKHVIGCQQALARHKRKTGTRCCGLKGDKIMSTALSWSLHLIAKSHRQNSCLSQPFHD